MFYVPEPKINNNLREKMNEILNDMTEISSSPWYSQEGTGFTFHRNTVSNGFVIIASCTENKPDYYPMEGDSYRAQKNADFISKSPDRLRFLVNAIETNQIEKYNLFEHLMNAYKKIGELENVLAETQEELERTQGYIYRTSQKIH